MAATETATTPALTNVLPSLFATSPEPLPFAPHLAVRAFLLERPHGNVLIYSNGLLGEDADRIEAQGGAERHYLNHWHEAIFGDGPNIGVPLYVHAADAEETKARAHVRATFSRRHRLDDDLEVIPTPGHTPGATAYLWDSGENRMLFTGDTLFLSGGEWVAAVLDSSDRDAYVASLELLRELEFDALVPWAAGVDEPPLAVVEAAEARERIGEVLERVRRGERS